MYRHLDPENRIIKAAEILALGVLRVLRRQDNPQNRDIKAENYNGIKPNTKPTIDQILDEERKR